MVNEKAKRVYDGKSAVVDKRLSAFGDQHKAIPRFVTDYLIAKYCDVDDPSPGLKKIKTLIDSSFIGSSCKELIKSKIKTSGRYVLFGNIKVRYDQSRDMYWAEIPVLGDEYVRVAPQILTTYGDALLTTGAWGSIEIYFDPAKMKSKLFPFCVINFTPMQITHISVDDFLRDRANFTNQEWMDLLINTVGFNPMKLDQTAKSLILCRLIPFVEENVNLIELGPCQTGKTYSCRSLSCYSYVVSGSNTTMATLFYNKARRKLGLLGIKDVIMFDEIASMDSSKMAEVINSLKDYLEGGKFGRGTDDFNSGCSVVLAGNIDCDRNTKSVKPTYQHLFETCPELISGDRAFFDRVHGYIPGWLAPEIKADNLSVGVGFMCDYYAEILHRMRTHNYQDIVLNRVNILGTSIRNKRALVRLASGLIKLMFCHKTANTITEAELSWAMDLAINMRQRVLDQLAIIAPGEFSGQKLSYQLRRTG